MGMAFDRMDLLKNLLRIPTVNPPGDELPAAQYLHDTFQKSGLMSELVPLDGNRASVVARLLGEQPGKSLVFSGHLDVVPVGSRPWDHDPFAAEEVDGRLYGRGASDMKAGVAAMVMALLELKAEDVTPACDVVFVGSAGEEAGCVGARDLCDRGYLDDAGGIVISEPTRNDLEYAHKGALWLALETRGRTAHGSTPHLGVNAVEGMVRILDRVTAALDRECAGTPESELGQPTFALTQFVGGVKTNVIPDMCRAEIDMRTIPGQSHDEIADLVETVADETAGAIQGLTVSVQRINDLPGFFTAKDEPFLVWVRRVAGGVRGQDVPLDTSPGYTDDRF